MNRDEGIKRLIRIALIAGLAGLAYYGYRKLSDAQKLCYKVAYITGLKIKPPNAYLSFVIRFKNPSDSTITIKEVKTEILANGIFVSKIISNDPITIPKRSIKEHQFVAILPLQNLINIVPDIIRNAYDIDKIKELFTFRTYVNVRVGIIEVKKYEVSNLNDGSQDNSAGSADC